MAQLKIGVHNIQHSLFTAQEPSFPPALHLKRTKTISTGISGRFSRLTEVRCWIAMFSTAFSNESESTSLTLNNKLSLNTLVTRWFWNFAVKCKVSSQGHMPSFVNQMRLRDKEKRNWLLLVEEYLWDGGLSWKMDEIGMRVNVRFTEFFFSLL